MSLTGVHQVVIVGAILLSVIFGLRSVWLYSLGADGQEMGGGGREIALALGAWLVAGALGLYLKRFRDKLRGSEGPRR